METIEYERIQIDKAIRACEEQKEQARIYALDDLIEHYDQILNGLHQQYKVVNGE